MKTALMTYALAFSYAMTLAQDDPLADTELSQLADDIFSQQEIDANYEDFYERFIQIRANPLNINTVTYEELSSLFILKDVQIQAILKRRQQAGNYLSIYELQSIPEIDQLTFDRLYPFVRVYENTNFSDKLWDRITKKSNRYLILRLGRTLEKQHGYTENTSNLYEGSPDKLYFRFRQAQYGDFSVGITGEKDAGESIKWTKKTKGMDYLSYHVQIRNAGRFNNLIIGDYGCQFGQGLMLGTAFGFGKNAESVQSMRRSNLGFFPYTSVYESNFFRGVAASVPLIDHLTVHTFFSSRNREATLSGEAGDPFVSSLGSVGLHRTAREQQNHKSIRETNAGQVWQYKKNLLDIGLMIHYIRFNHSITPTPNIYNRYYFSGTDHSNLGGYVNYSFQNIFFFGEWVYGVRAGKGGAMGALMGLTPKFDMALHVRHFAKNFYGFYTNAIAEKANPQGESGFYWGLKYMFNKKYLLSGYVDLFQFHGLNHRSYSPSEGNEWLLKAQYTASKTTTIFVQMRQQTKVRNANQSTQWYQTTPYTQRHYWFNASYAQSKNLRFRTRIQYNTFRQEASTTQGITVLHDISWKRNKVKITGRMALFDTDNFDTRLYVYEPDMRWAFSFPSYSDRGVRRLILIEYKWSSKITTWIRWTQTRYMNRSEIGSGGEKIEGNIKTDIKFQVTIKLS